jgi:transposase
MIQIEFSPAEIDALEYERYHYPHPQVQRKMEVLYLKSQGVAHQDIRRIARICETTLTTYLRQYQEGGLARLKEQHYPGQAHALLGHATTLEAHFTAHPPATSAEARQVIIDLTGIERSPTQVRACLKRLGLRYRKVGYVPGKATTPEKLAEQETFQHQELEPRLAEAQAGQRTVLFMDAAHFVQGAVLGMLWCVVRLFIASPSGRRRFNVLGALNAVTKEVLTFTNETYITAESVCQLLTQIAAHYAGTAITVVLDNARYQHCALVLSHAATLQIELLFLPAYSPHLNLIERYWRFVRKQCLYSKYYPDFTGFKQAIADCIQTAHTKHRQDLETLLTWNFQSFRKVQISAV